MADQKLTALTAITSVSDDDLMYIVDDPGGSPLSRKITALDFKNSSSLTDFEANGNWKVFYTDGSGVPIELALGASGTALTSNGASSAPTFAVPSGDGDGIYDGSGTVPSAAIATLTDYIRFDSGDISVGTGGVPAAKLHVKGDNDGDGLRVDVDIWNNAFLVQELSGSPFVSVFSSTKVSNEIFRVSGGNAMFSNNITCSGATSVGSAINIADGDFIQIGATPAFGLTGTATQIDMAASGSIELRDNTNAVVATLINNTGNFGVGAALTPLERVHSDAKVRADTVFNVNGTDGIGATYTFGGGGSGDIATMTFSGGILTAVTTVP